MERSSMAGRWWNCVCAVRVSSSGLFYAFVALSVVFTLLVISEPFGAVPVQSTILHHHHEATAPRRLTLPAATAEKYRAKLRMMLLRRSPPLMVGRGGWKLLPGNVVVHDGIEAINPHDYGYMLNPTEVCAGSGGIRLLVFVESDAKNGDKRQAIRETWALPILQKILGVRVVFLIGIPSSSSSKESLAKEFYSYGDVVQENFTEGFKYLGLKSVMGLKWAKTFCPQADFVLKTDDDILVHLPNLLAVLAGYRNVSGLLLCHKNKSRQIVRREPSLLKYQVSIGELPGTYFPTYCGGFAYAMSRDAVVALYEASLRTPYFFIEDVYVTGFCRHKAGLVARDHHAIVLKPLLTIDQAPCSFAEGRVTSQELDVYQMRSMWKAANTKGFFCPVPLLQQSS